MNRSSLLLLRILNRDLFQFLRERSRSDIEEAAHAMRLSERERDFLLSLQPAADSGDPKTFAHALAEANSVAPGLYPFAEQESSSRQNASKAKFNEALRNSRVALVGPSSTVIGSGQKKLLEEFDYIARMNFQWPVPPHLDADIGSRMDILYHCCNGDYDISSILSDAFLQTKFVCYERNIDARLLYGFCAEHQIPSIDISDVYEELSKQLVGEANTGLAAIQHLASAPLKELYITGLTFFQRPYYGGYRGHGADSKYWQDSLPPDAIHRHPVSSQLSLFCSLAFKDKRIRMDETLSEIVSEHSSDQ